jgi:hypothetical protein
MTSLGGVSHSLPRDPAADPGWQRDFSGLRRKLDFSQAYAGQYPRVDSSCHVWPP